MAENIITLFSGRFAIHPVEGDEQRPFIGSRAACIRHAYATDGDISQYFRASILKYLPTPDWWLLRTVEDWAIHQLPVDHPAVIAAYSADQGKKRLQSADFESWINDWLLNGEKPRKIQRALCQAAAHYLAHSITIKPRRTRI